MSFLKSFGLKVPANNNYQSFYFDEQPPPEILNVVEYSVEGDWSGAAFLLVACAVAGSVTVNGLDADSTQADKAILDALKSTGAILHIEKNAINIQRAKLKSFQFDATDCPDLFPPLVALAACSEGITTIKGVNRLTHKESNRALTLQEEFGKLNVRIELQNNLMLIDGGNGIKGAHVHSHHDHRIAMACAVAGLVAEGDTTIDVAEAVNKSYPQFWEHLQQLQKAKASMDI